jgi:hypothetical protein
MEKRCPTCNRSFDDETLSFCLEDGTPLVSDSAGRANSQETLVSPSPSAAPTMMGASPPAQNYGQLPGKATISAAQADIPGLQAYLPPPRQRSKWPWVIAILAIVLIVIGGIVVAAIFVPPMLQKSGTGNRPAPTPVRPAATPAWTSTPSASPAAEADDVPDDEDEVLSQLTKLEEEWTQANVKGDKQALERILADEYVGGPTTHSKRAYIDNLTPDASIKSWELSDLTVNQDGDRATVNGTLKDETEKGTEVYEFTDKFIWRDHRWQAVASNAVQQK